MLTFFRKDKGGRKAAVPDAGPATAVPRAPVTVAPAVVKTVSGPVTTSGLQVLELDVQVTPAVWDAVMYFANGRVDDAAKSLRGQIRQYPDLRDPQPWRLLFEIFESSGQRQAFDDLALEYAMRFESSPPTWRKAGHDVVEQASADRPVFAFAPGAQAQRADELETFLRSSATVREVTLDFSRLHVPEDEPGLQVVDEFVRRLVADGKVIRLVGGEAFIVRLSARRTRGRLATPGWLLLLRLLQLLGREAEFEAVALEYAIQFEISPPSYEPIKRGAVSEVTDVESSAATGQAFALPDVVGANSEEIFNELRRFALPLSNVDVQLGAVSRIDFAAAGMLVNTIMELAQAGKKIVFRGGSEIVCLLLQMVGAGQYALIQANIRK